MVNVPLRISPPPDFVYDPERPTYYNELYAWALHKHQAALSSAGASVDVENVSHADKAAAIASYSASLSAWSETAFNQLSSFLAGGENAPLPAIPDLPLLPAILENAVALLPGGKIGLFFKAALPFVKGFFALKEKLRPTDPVRLLDKALLKDSWFLPGYRKSWLQEISEKLDTISSRSITIDLQPLIDVLSAQDCNNTQVSIAQVLLTYFIM